ncbi:MAG: 16S rRNA (cytosine(967)-C(5))-methyltransferase RsmB, partial [Syntrophales bacterium]|nr:16S rRNA (cytosine(967)-C(5))-methyltransferase RsmB [Syntrophales bacterium]
IRNILRVALYQMFCMDKIPGYAAVNEAVILFFCLYPGREGLVNAILRNSARRKKEIVYPGYCQNPVEFIASFHSHPHWLVARWAEYFGIDETLEICEANNRIPPLAVRANLMRTTREKLMCELSKEGFHPRPSPLSPDAVLVDHHPYPLAESPLYIQGFFQFQDEASQLVSYLLNPGPDETVLDMCAGSGIKSTHIGALMKNQGSILAVDKNSARLAQGAELAQRFGIGIIERIAADGEKDFGNAFYGRFDRILVDAPCTGLGTLRRKPEIKWFANEGDSMHYAKIQGALLKNCSLYLKSGGTMVYATCTTEPEENEELIDCVLARDSSLSLCTPREFPRPDTIDSGGFFRTLPHRHGADGFFGAILKKTGNR